MDEIVAREAQAFTTLEEYIDWLLASPKVPKKDTSLWWRPISATKGRRNTDGCYLDVDDDVEVHVRAEQVLVVAMPMACALAQPLRSGPSVAFICVTCWSIVQ